MKKEDVAAVVPVFNPEPGLKNLCETLLAAYRTVIVVDDGSRENVEDFKSLPQGITLIRHQVNKGKGRAIKTAIEWLKENSPEVQTAVFVDGDGQHRPGDVAKVVEQSQKTDRVVLGVRDFSKSNVPFRSRFGNVLTSFLVRIMYRIPIYDTQTGLRAIPRRLFDLMLQTAGERYEYEMRLFGMLDSEREKMDQVPIETIYISNNRASHFHPIHDSMRVYRGLFGGRPIKFALSSLLGFTIDVSVFHLICTALSRFSLSLPFGIVFATAVARILSATANYQCNRRFVFESRSKLAISVGKYVVLACVIAALSSVFTTVFSLTFGAEGAGITGIKILVDIALFVMSYQVQKWWVFGSRSVLGVPLVRRCGRGLLPVFLLFVLMAIDATLRLIADFEFPGCKSWALISSLSLRASLLFLALPMIFRKGSRFIMPLLFVLLAIFEAFEVIACLSMKITVRGEIFAILLGSSAEETASFLADYMTFGYITAAVLFLVFLAWGCFVFWRSPGPYPRRRVRSYLLGVLLVVVSLVSRPWSETLYGDFIIDSISQFGRYRGLAQAVRHPDVSNVVLEGRNVPVVVLLLGESACRDYWHLYGYELESTPCMDARGEKGEIQVFDDVLAPWSQTQEALYLILSQATLAGDDRVVATLPQALSAAGYRCVLLSAQGHWGIYDSIDTLLYAGCEKSVYVEDMPELKGSDERLLPFIDEELKASKEDGKPIVLFVHLYGNHYPFVNRYPESEAVFSANEDRSVRGRSLNSYADSIRCTDKVLDQIIDRLSDDGREAVMVHFSDHGETPRSPANRTLTDPDLWRIPFFTWCSPKYKEAYPERMAMLDRIKSLPLQTDRFYAGFLELANVRLKGRENESFLSADFDRSLERIVGNGRTKVGPGYGARN